MITALDNPRMKRRAEKPPAAEPSRVLLDVLDAVKEKEAPPPAAEEVARPAPAIRRAPRPFSWD